MYQFLQFRVLLLLRFLKHRAHPRTRMDASFYMMPRVFHIFKFLLSYSLCSALIEKKTLGEEKNARRKKSTFLLNRYLQAA